MRADPTVGTDDDPGSVPRRPERRSRPFDSTATVVAASGCGLSLHSTTSEPSVPEAPHTVGHKYVNTLVGVSPSRRLGDRQTKYRVSTRLCPTVYPR